MKKLFLILSVGLAFAKLAAAAITPALNGSPTANGGNYLWSYEISVDSLEQLVAGASFFTIYDFVGYVPGSVMAPAGWTTQVALTGLTPSTQNPPDNPTISNLTFIYVGATSPDQGPINLAGFSAVSTFGGENAGGAFSYQAQKTDGITDASSGNIMVPALSSQTHGYFFNQANANDDVGDVNLSAVGSPPPTFGSCPDAPFTSETCAIGSGAGLFITAGVGTSLYAGTSTISLWYDAAPSALTTRTPVLNDSGVGGGCTQAFDLSNGSLPAGHMGWYYGYTLNCGSSSQIYGHIDLGAVSSGVWHMYTLTNDGSYANVYIDGVLAAGFPNPSTGEDASRQTSLLGDANGTWAFGAMRDVYVANAALGVTQVCNLFLAQGGVGGCAGGTIQVTANLPSATFTITGPATFMGSGTTATFNNAPTGAYTATFGAVPSYSTPAPQMQFLNAGGVTTFSATYQPTFVGTSGTSSNPTLSTNEPINTATGNYYTSHADLVVPGKGLAFNFTRFYNSLDPYSGPLGVGWTHLFNIFLTINGANITVKEADGHQSAFAATVGGSYKAITIGVFDTLQQNANGTFTLTRTNQTQLNFSTTGQLSSVIDRNGNTQTLSYNASGNLATIVDSSGRTFTFSTDATGRITTLTDPIGRSVQYGYDTTGDLAWVSDTSGGLTQYAYDAGHRMISATDARGVTYLTNVYDTAGRVTAQTNARGFTTTLAYNTPSAGTTSFSDPLGNTTRHIYDSNLRIISVINALGDTTTFTYDANNDRTSVTNQDGNTTDFAYDGNGNTTGITDPLGHASALTYDTKNDLITATSPKGNATSFAYDSNGNLLTIKDALGDTTSFAYAAGGLLTSKTDARGNTTAFSYDAFGDLTKITDAQGNSTTLAYDAIARLTSVTDAKGHTAQSAYDALSRIISVVDPLGDQTQFGYDPVNNLLKITDANGHATAYAYDGIDNLTTVTDAAGNVTRYAYDANNNRTVFTNAKSNATSYGFDQLNRLNRIVDTLSFVSSYSYDAVGNVISTTDANEKTNQFSYDPLNRLVRIAYADGTNVAYSYDADGDRLTMADAHGTTAYAYDALDRMISVTEPGSKIVQYGYDAVGNRSVLTYPDGKKVSYAYDRLNRLTGATDWLGKTTNYSYDATGNLIETQYPNRAAIAFGYDAANRLTQVVNSAFGLPLLNLNYALDKVGNRTSLAIDGIPTEFAYDPLNELLSAQLGPLKTTWAYDSVGNRVKQVAPNGTTAYTFDADDRLLLAGSTSFTYDANGNRLTETTRANTQAFSYDAANRLRQVRGPGVNSSFAYDGDGNRVAQTVKAGTYAYVNDINTSLPVVVSEQGPDGPIDYAYGMGLIEEYSPTFNYFYHFDGLGSVIALTDAHGLPAAAYAYDPWGNPLLNVPDTLGTRNKFRFTGQALDPGPGLYYLRARYYDPSIGRFVTPDSVPGNISNPNSLQRYTYSLSNPVRYADPSGHDAWDAFFNWCSSFSDTCGSVAQATQKAEQYNTCTLNIGSSTNGCNNGFPQAYSNAATNVVSTGVNVTINIETNPTTYGLPTIPTPWWSKVGSFLFNLFAPKTAYAASPQPASIPSSPTGNGTGQPAVGNEK